MDVGVERCWIVDGDVALCVFEDVECSSNVEEDWRDASDALRLID